MAKVPRDDVWERFDTLTFPSYEQCSLRRPDLSAVKPYGMHNCGLQILAAGVFSVTKGLAYMFAPHLCALSAVCWWRRRRKGGRGMCAACCEYIARQMYVGCTAHLRARRRVSRLAPLSCHIRRHRRHLPRYACVQA